MNRGKSFYLLGCWIALFLSAGYCQEKQTLKGLNALVTQAFQEGKYQQGIVIAKKAYQLAKSRLGEEHRATVKAMSNLALMHKHLGKYHQAEALYRKALSSIKERSAEEKDLSTPSLMINLAALYTSSGRYSQAEPLYFQALKLMRQEFGERHPATLTCLNNLASLYSLQGKYAQAEQFYQEVLSLQKKVLGEKAPATLRSMSNLARVLSLQAKYSQAKEMLVTALEARKEVLGEKHPDTLVSLGHLAHFYKQHGKYQQAKSLFEQVLQIRKKVLGRRHPATLSARKEIASLYHQQGEYTQAESLLVQVLKIEKQALGSKHPATLTSLNNLGFLYWSQGEYTKASPLLYKAWKLRKEVLGAKHPDTLISLNNMAQLYLDKEEYTTVEPLLRKIWQIRKKALGEKHPDTLISLNNLAALYKLQKNYTKAASLLRKIWKLRKETLGERHPNTILTMRALAVVYDYQGKHAQAEDLHVASLKLVKETFGTKHPETLISLSNLALFYSSQGKYDKALAVKQELLPQKYLFLVKELQGSSEKTRLKMLEKFDMALERDKLFSTLKRYPHKDQNRLALYFVANYKGILLRISRKLHQLFAESENQELLVQLSQKRSQYSNLSFHSKMRRQNPSLVTKLQREIEKLEKKLIWQNDSVKSLLSDVSPPEICQTLTPKELLVDFVIYHSIDLSNRTQNEKKLAALIVDEGKVEIVWLGNAQKTLTLVQEYRKKIQQKQTVTRLAQKLYQKIFAPLTPHLAKKNKLYLVPDGILHLLPFPSLLNSQGAYLAREQNIVVLSSSRDLVLRKKKEKSHPAAIFAYPAYGKGKGKRMVQGKPLHFLPLPGTEQEANAIAPILNTPPKIYSHHQASEKNISQLESPKILHIATHGYFVEPDKQTNKELRSSLKPISLHQQSIYQRKPLANPLVYSGLALAGANHPESDGILTALEVLTLNLHGTKLVVLSACDTGVGKIRQGEGVYSLQRAFQEAGAETIVASLWKVNDRATRIFMQKFYQRYMRGDSAHKAARDTQLDFINSSRYSHPYYWSSFVVIGGRSDDLDLHDVERTKNSSPPRQKSSALFWIGLFAIVGLASGWFLFSQRQKQQRILEERKARRERRLAQKKGL